MTRRKPPAYASKPISRDASSQAFAECRDCGAQWRAGNALACARIHAASHAHCTSGWTMMQATYDGSHLWPTGGAQ